MSARLLANCLLHTFRCAPRIQSRAARFTGPAAVHGRAVRFISLYPCILAICFVLAPGAQAQRGTGELRVTVTDPAGAAVSAAVSLINDSTKTSQSLVLPADGRYTFKNLPFGFYRLSVAQAGFVPYAELLEVRSEVPVSHPVRLSLVPLETTVEVAESAMLVDPNRTGVAYYIGSEEIRERPTGLPGRGVIDRVVMQPGWVLEANGILHPRGSEYDTQIILDGFPLQENRSPGFAAPLDETATSVKAYTSGIPAEFGNKLGGVIEINTDRQAAPGFHGAASLQGGSFGNAGSEVSAQVTAGKTTLGGRASGFFTDRFLDPAVVANYSNHASGSMVSGSLERDFTEADRLRLAVTHRQAKFLVPNDLLQQAAGQRQDRASHDIGGQASYQHVFSPGLVGVLRGMVREVSANLLSNQQSTPIAAHQDRSLREGYFNASLAGHAGRHEWKVGGEARFASIRENFGYQITAYGLPDPTPGDPVFCASNPTDQDCLIPIFGDALPPTYDFTGRATHREQSAYVQDLVRLGRVTVSAGLRLDHYRLLVQETALSPRLGVSWSLPRVGTVLHASYDRTFGTPPFENLLVSAASQTQFTEGFYLPLKPSRGNYYEVGFTQALGGTVRLDANYFHRHVRHFLDDEVLLNTGVSFPIAFDSARITGVEAKLEVLRWGKFTGFVTYSNATGIGQFPISGGLFLDDEDAGLLTSTARFRISQDQRHTARGLVRYQIFPRLWAAWSASYNSGLPIEDEGGPPDPDLLTAQYGAEIIEQVKFSSGRVRPSFAVNASAGAELWRRERRAITFQVDGMNLTNRLNVLNFTGLFSGTAVAPPRSFGLRLGAEF